MEQKYDRSEEILLFMQPHMEERFRESAGRIRKLLEERGNEMWTVLRENIRTVLSRSAGLQAQGKKGRIAYLVCSFQQSGVYTGGLLLRLETLDEGFYLDEQEAEGYYDPRLLQEEYRKDLEFLHQKVRRQFIRVQNYELDGVSMAYTEYYNALMCRIIESMDSLIMRTVTESGAALSEEVQIMYGEYMGDAEVIYAFDAAGSGTAEKDNRDEYVAEDTDSHTQKGIRA